jgi:hypothetical protein
VESTAETKSGEREFGPDGTVDYDELVLRWMDHYLRGIDNSVEREDPVRYFVMGVNKWRLAKAWPPAATATAFYLSPGAKTNVGRLTVEEPIAKSSSMRFVADPANPVINPYTTSGAHDYQKLAERADVLTFETPPLRRDTEVTGPIHASIFVSCTCRDLDLWVRILDAAPDGRTLNLMSPGLDVQRASERKHERKPQWLVPNSIYQIDLDNLLTSNAFLAGHRIAVQISASFFPNFSRNLQNGKSEITSADTHKSTITVYSDSTHASRLILPVVSAD